MIKLFQSTPGIWDRGVEEYGQKVPNKCVEACVVNLRDCFVILIRASASLIKCLEHEMKHIDNDFKKS